MATGHEYAKEYAKDLVKELSKHLDDVSSTSVDSNEQGTDPDYGYFIKIDGMVRIGVWFHRGYPHGPGIYCGFNNDHTERLFITHEVPNVVDVILNWWKANAI